MWHISQSMFHYESSLLNLYSKTVQIDALIDFFKKIGIWIYKK